MSQQSTDFSDRERGTGSRGLSAPDYPPDYVHPWQSWCAVVGVSTTTAWRLVKAGKGPIVTQLSTKLKGVRHRHHLTWLAAREQHQDNVA
jgi:hypothetical protein